MSLLITIFLLVLFTEIVGWIGKPLLLGIVSAIYARTINAGATRRLQDLKKSILEDQKQLAQTSSQDEFAKWARLKRKVDKGLSDLEKLNSEQNVKQTALSLKSNVVLWVLTSGLQLAITWWYRREAVFYLPRGWFTPIEWWLALPFAPKGSVSCGAWQMVCRRSIKLFGRVFGDLVQLSS
ncbi:WRB/Get1 family [Cantharellus anzutake]|uniref:WRB/Get1 family n=1 Tax=Cantharellus anzutake TaxID=1750568 RepID=UPI001903114A|nr:WRB/Get1 family [Cantharellus anzutake]KAF8331908.1 WRB/Get1 family [Cantharellus anzutake]